MSNVTGSYCASQRGKLFSQVMYVVYIGSPISTLSFQFLFILFVRRSLRLLPYLFCVGAYGGYPNLITSCRSASDGADAI